MRYIRHFQYYTCRLLSKLGVLEYFSFTLSQKYRKQYFLIPVINGIGYHNLLPSREEWMDEIVRRLLIHRKGSIIDAGANQGQTLLKLAALDKSIDYYGFEPNPVCYNYCNVLIKANRLVTFKVFPAGLSDKPKIAELFGDTEAATGASVIKNFRENKIKYRPIHFVSLINGDAVFQEENVSSINFIKVDVEGGEWEVMHGFKATLQRYLPVIIIEILPVYSLEKENGKMRKDRQDKLLRLLKQLTYKMFLIREIDIRLEMLEDIPVHGDMGRTNYLFLPPDDIEHFRDLIIPAGK